MSNTCEKICRLCLKVICSNDFDRIENVTMQMFNGILLKVELNKNKENVMCSECAANLQKSFDFKLACISLKNKELISTKLNSAKTCSVENRRDDVSDRKPCKFCAKLIEAHSSMYLNETKENIPIVNMLQHHMPELELNISEDLISCEACLKSLQHFLSFTITCSHTEQEVKYYSRTEVTYDKNKIKLEDMEHLAPANYTDSDAKNVYEIEEVFVNSEGDFTIKTEMKDDNMEIDKLDASNEAEEVGTKSKQSNKESMYRLSSWISAYEKELSVMNDSEIKCNICSKTIQVTRRHHVTQHVNGKVHLMKLSSGPRDTFNEELCETLLAVNIPLYKVHNPALKHFLEKYMCRTIPGVTTLRKNCIANTYNKMMNTIRKNIYNNYLWISADETTDHQGRCVLNIAVGTLSPHGPSDSYLVATKIIEAATAENVALLINSALDDLCINNEENRNKVLLFLTDAASYMLKTGQLLKKEYPYILHVTCTAYALHRICEFIGSEFKNVDTLIGVCKKVFLKVPRRLSLYKNMYPSLPLPPVPIINRWGTWIEAAVFYAKNLEKLEQVVNSLDDDVQCVIKCKNIVQQPDLYPDLRYINKNFSCLPEHIEYFETHNVPLKERISRYKSIITRLRNMPFEFGHRLKQKVETIYATNPDVSILFQICSENFENQQTRHKYQHLVPYFRYAPATSSHVERTFSKFKDVVSPQRLSFTETNLERHFIINANSKVLCNMDDEEL